MSSNLDVAEKAFNDLVAAVDDLPSLEDEINFLGGVLGWAQTRFIMAIARDNIITYHNKTWPNK